MTDSWKNAYYWKNYWFNEVHEWEAPEGEKNPYEGWDAPGYWDVMGDGWNPGHTMTEGERYYHDRTLICFAPGYYDRERGILWKHRHQPAAALYDGNPDTVTKDLAKRILRAAQQQYHDYEVESYVGKD
jgi:hypothetical protein